MEDTQEHNDHHTGPETSEENTPRTQEGLGTRAEGAHNEDTTEREDTGHERENREENGHGNEEHEQRTKERSDGKEMTDTDEETAAEEQENGSWDEDKDHDGVHQLKHVILNILKFNRFDWFTIHTLPFRLDTLLKPI